MKLELRCASNVSVTPVCILLSETHEGYADLVYFWCWVEDYDLRTVGATVLLEGPTMPPSVRPRMIMANGLRGSHVAGGGELHWYLRSSVLGCGPAKGLLCPERGLFFFLWLLVPPNRVIFTLFFSFSCILSPDRVVAFLFHCGDLGHCFHYIIHNDNWA